MRLRIAKIREQAADRPAGYVDAVLAAGSLDGDWLDLTPEAHAALREKYRPQAPSAPSLPSVPAMAARAARAAVAESAAILSGAPPVPEEESARRLAICESCPEFRPADRRCAKCGCYMALKTRLRSQHCPAGKW